MAASTVTTPLLGTRVSARLNLTLHALPYAAILVSCFLCNFVPLIPLEMIQKSWFWSLDADTAEILAFTGPEFWQDVAWPVLIPMLDDATFLAVHQHADSSRRRLIRKSEALGSILKGLILKVTPTIVTTVLVLGRFGLRTWLSWLLAFIGAFVVGLVPYLVSSPVIRVVQARKSAREDKVYVCLPFAMSRRLIKTSESVSPDANQQQTLYTMAMKTQDGLRRYWKGLLFAVVLTLLLKLGRGNNVALCLRLWHQVRSKDETYNKTFQAWPKASRIGSTMKGGNGVVSLVLEACTRVWAVRWMPMKEVPEFEGWSSGIGGHVKRGRRVVRRKLWRKKGKKRIKASGIPP
jgi:hypothetical protein